MKRRQLGLAWAAPALGLAAGILAGACGGNVVVDHDDVAQGGAGGSGGGPSTTTTSTTTSTSTTTTTTTSTTTSTTTTTTTTTSTGGGPPGPALVEVPLGSIPLGSTFTFDVPPNTLGFTLVAHPPGSLTSDLGIGVEKLWPPDESLLVDNYSLGPQNELFYYAGNGIIAAGVPQSDDPQAMPLQTGTWKARLGDFDSGGPTEAEVSVWLRQTVDGEFHGGVLDVNVFRVKGVATDQQILNVVQDAYSDYVGLKLGTVTFYELPDKYDVIDENNFYTALNETNIISNRPALNLLYVSLLTGELDGAAGVSSGLPGVPVIHGSNASGIISMFFDDPFDTTILEHEGGHFGGLFHTSEFVVGNGDFLSDTPFCEDVQTQQDACPDFDNIMFPTGGNGLLFSPQQTRVLHGSALYRGIYEPGAAPATPFIVAPEPAAPGSAPLPWLGSFEGDSLPPSSSPPRLTLSSSPWAAGLPAGAAAALTGLACPHGTAGLQHAWSATVSALAGVPDTALLALAGNPAAPNHIRARALSVLGTRSPGAALSTLADLAAEGTTPTPVRIAAIRAVARATPAARATLKSRLDTSSTALVARLARRLL